ncbi:TetR family transcriptional regulator [Bradyrhizobium sp. SSBR45G]|uniref:TetR/AcrR family transcriptional regulator n=1 Tax=unclassified Bradyrhizobium TaxID=2631580 RepID=UPI002342A052|nr:MULTISPECIES: TetR/AcrR family transcriptional regulator [unclassified Bradyrhizobium]GLH76207.1 TetR family transcriptional regulator [Bradyrhizobium sp. SSBR45G]GLH83309.1 TetR family transcriptional regulator [Bradyrhizobium sp. SSBR45R]
MPPRIAEVNLPGVTPSRQQRSRETTLALLTAGAELLCTRSLAELSISELCAHFGATVGAFYSRFDSKEAYFNALLALTLEDGREQLMKLPPTAPVDAGDLDAACHQLVRGIVLWMRRHKGVLRAALVRSEHGPNNWTGFKELAQALSQRAAPLLRPSTHEDSANRRKPAATAKERKTAAFGIQVVLGTLVNAILNDPGPLSIDDDEIAERLGACLVLLLRAGPDTTAPR